MNKILVVFGTRPEAIKLIPVMRELKRNNITYDLLNTNQHDAILDDLLSTEGIKPNYRLCICGQYKDLIDTKAAMLNQMNTVLGKNIYSAVIVQGDTLSALTGAEYGFMRQIPVYHVEAGMRTYDLSNPYPEESFRRMISVMTSLHFCPSEDEKRNLLAEGFSDNGIHVVGNTFVDYRTQNKPFVSTVKKQVLITLHRRENLPYLKKILGQISELAKDYPDYNWLFPVHPNPVITKLAQKYLGSIANVVLCEPLPSDEFYKQLLSSEIVISDSGGVQEECILNAKKLLIVREVSERKANFDFMELVSPTEEFCCKFKSLLSRQTTHMDVDYYGKGDAAQQIVQIILKEGES